MKSSNKENERRESYPKLTETDAQLKNQDEYTERKSTHRNEDMPVHGGKPKDNKPPRKREQHWDIL